MPYLRACADAMGASANSSSVWSLGTSTEGGLNIPIEMKSLGSEGFKQEFGGPTEKRTFSVWSGRGFERRAGGLKNVRAHQSQYVVPEHVPGQACFAALHGNRFTAELLPNEDLEGKSAIHIRITGAQEMRKPRGLSSDPTPVLDLLIDPVSYVVIATRKPVFSPDAIQNSDTLQSIFGDYRRVDGMLLPFQIEQTIDGQQLRTVTFTQVRTDVQFAQPEFEQ